MGKYNSVSDVPFTCDGALWNGGWQNNQVVVDFLDLIQKELSTPVGISEQELKELGNDAFIKFKKQSFVNSMIRDWAQDVTTCDDDSDEARYDVDSVLSNLEEFVKYYQKEENSLFKDCMEFLNSFPYEEIESCRDVREFSLEIYEFDWQGDFDCDWQN